jgi:uncharacterized membrane protein
MSRRTKKAALRNGMGAFMVQLAGNEEVRNQIIDATRHGLRAKQRTDKHVGLLSLVERVTSDAEVRAEMNKTVRDLQEALRKLQPKPAPSHKLRNTLLLAGVGGGLAFAWRKRGTSITNFGGADAPRVIESTIEVDVPVSTAYNQWTQFEEFPRFMDGVEEVRQLDDTRLHWVASIGGRRAEWDAKILEQHPDHQISWISEDGNKNRGTVSFKSLGERRTLVRLTMSYQIQGFVEAVGAAAGLERRRIQADLARFKELIESRGAETGAWREDVSAGHTSTY